MKFRLSESTNLTEESNGGQRTFKIFLCDLLKEFLDIKLDPDDYHLHHINGKHQDNRRANLALMLKKDHRSLHGKVRGRDTEDYSERLITALNTMKFSKQPYYVSECLNHIFDKLTRGLGQDAITDDIEAEKSAEREKVIT